MGRETSKGWYKDQVYVNIIAYWEGLHPSWFSLVPADVPLIFPYIHC